MIITEDTKAALINNDPLNPQYPSLFDMHPPDYEATISTLPAAASQTTPLLEGQAKSKHEQRTRATLRFFGALLVVLVFVLVVLSITIALYAFSTGQYTHGGRDNEYPWGTPVLPERSDGVIMSPGHCQPDWSDVILGEEEGMAEFRDPQFSMISYPQFLHPRRGPRGPHNGNHGGGKGRHDRPHRQPAPPPPCLDYNCPPPPHGPRGRWPGHQHAPTIYRATYSLPSDLESLYFLSRGAHSHGAFHYETGHESQRNITIDVVMRYWNKSARDSVNMCLLRKSTKHMGFGIFTPKKDWDWMPENHRSVRLDVLVHLPASSIVSDISNLESNLPNFSQFVGRFDRGGAWDSVHLAASDGSIFSKDLLRVNNLSLITSNGEIRGQFFSDSALSLATTNGGIFANIMLLDGAPRDRDTSASVMTTNGSIDASITLASMPYMNENYTGSGGAFIVDIANTNGRVDLAVPLAPLGSSIALTSKTSNSGHKVRLHRAFEGSFQLSTSNSTVGVTSDLNPDDDPRGEGSRPNLVLSKNTSNLIEGLFWWGSSTSSSVAEVRTSNGPINLTFI